MESRPWLGRPEVDCLHLTASQRRRRKKALKEAEKAPTSPVAAPSPEPALSDAEEQAEPEAPEPLEPAPLPIELSLPPAPVPAPAPAVEDDAARPRRQLEALQLKTAAPEREKNALEREKKAMESERESQLCTVCLDAPRSHVLFPCHHRCLCLPHAGHAAAVPNLPLRRRGDAPKLLSC